MTETRRSWDQVVDDVLDRPLVERATLLMTAAAVGQVLSSAFSIWAVDASGAADMRYFGSVLGAGMVGVPLSALALWLVSRRDPDGTTATARTVLAPTAVTWGLFGVAIAYALGFWASPLTLFAPMSALFFGVVFSRGYALLALGFSVSSIVVLEVLRFAGVLDYAPGLVDRSVDDTGSGLRTLATSIPLATFTALTLVLGLAVLATIERQRAALARSHEVIRRYVPAQVADAVLERGEDSTVLERRKITIFFSDVVTFTETTDRMEPEELARVLDEYFSEMTRIAERYDGTIDELIGDAVLIFFGAPTATDDRDHAVRALRMAAEMQQGVSRLNASWEAAGIDAVFRIRMGVHTGVVTVGNVGSGARRKYAALGRAVNLAARIQTHCEPGDVLLSRSTWLLARDAVPCIPQGEVELKGVGRRTELYSVDLSAALVG